jgi:EAL domain-containing protein (putative c-di-GMP-specific phosphodiesterase class I)
MNLDKHGQDPAAPLPPMRILLLDDDPFILNFLRDLLAELGQFEVRCESDGRLALASLRRDPPDLLICDLSMPDMDGIEFLRFAAASSFQGSVLLHTGMDVAVRKAAENLAEAHGLHILGAYQKIIHLETLREALGRLGHLRRVHKPSAPIERLTIEELREGIAADRVEVYFQPKVSVREQRMVGAECLARWRHPSRGILPPAAFIHLIEQYQLIDEFTLVVLKKAVAQLGQWLRQGHDFKIAVNVSMDNLNRLDLPEIFHRIVDQAGVDGSHIVLEMTETRLMDNLKVSLEILTRLRLKGFGLSIDDFGTGFSTMENLKRLPFNELKIDRAFVDGASHDVAARTILESSIRLGKVFDLTLVAEGVETREDWDLIAASGCDQVQGYYVARPMPAAELIKWKLDWERPGRAGPAVRRQPEAGAPNAASFNL